MIRSPEFSAESRMVGICARSGTVTAPGMTNTEPLFFFVFFKKPEAKRASADVGKSVVFNRIPSLLAVVRFILHKQHPSLYL